MSKNGNVGVLIAGNIRHAYEENAQRMVYLTNTSGNSRDSGDVVIFDPDHESAFKTTTIEGDTRVAGVIPQTDLVNCGLEAPSKYSVSDGNPGYVQQVGQIALVSVTGAVNIGQYLIASATAGRAKGVSLWQPGVFGVATRAAAGPGIGAVSAVLMPVQNCTVIDYPYVKLCECVITEPVATIDISIPSQAYTHLEIYFRARVDTPGAVAEYMCLRMNDDTTATNYDSGFSNALAGLGSLAAGQYNTDRILCIVPASYAPTGWFLGGKMTLPYYSATDHWKEMALSGTGAWPGYEARGGQAGGGVWKKNDAITKLNFSSYYAGKFIAGTRFAIFGVK